MEKIAIVCSNVHCAETTLSAAHAQQECADNPKIVKVLIPRPEVESQQMFLPPNPRPWERKKKGQKR